MAKPRGGEYFDGEPLGEGWLSWNIKEEGRFNTFLEPIACRSEPPLPDGRPVARIRMRPTSKHSNMGDNIHGGVTLAFVDIALFAAAYQFGALGARAAGNAVTIGLDTQFVGAGRLDEPLDALVELVRETGRLLFLRGMVVQGEADTFIVASFSGTIRKTPADRN